MSGRRLHGGPAAAIEAAAFALLTVDVALRGPVDGLDESVMDLLRGMRRSEAGLAVARAVTLLGEPSTVAALACSAVGVRLCMGRGKQELVRSVALVGGGALLRHGMCRALARERPPTSGWYAKPGGFSYPSKHTTLAALALLCLAPDPDGVTRLGVAGAAAAVAASRIYLGVHWPSDVAAGLLFAHLWKLLVDTSLDVVDRHPIHQ